MKKILIIKKSPEIIEELFKNLEQIEVEEFELISNKLSKKTIKLNINSHTISKLEPQHSDHQVEQEQQSFPSTQILTKKPH
ncbi:hypothetical protein DICPUDRAFT_147895 [Dictyostelium purpureum]|uniref:Uncharacterized protein n=1 Tax=Dictyostelium purpureum TaxID=5786 RepID=F0Z9P7_DICPU|nr:uncharacterized protein DICPUDRAFT_147895 [Dictyostelium purpureum]EGC39339.1 hypothetical protein DICPUDRAFT_147895 [Dictyostelium purpureum]|eukprot:XP_003284127.1 hypothetical protein DICPUDRAFT_147895 [Dictyostelium purpureum]